MDIETAIDYLSSSKQRNPSEIGQAVDVLYQEHPYYKEITRQHKLKISPHFLRQRHGIFKLPKGIQWKVDQDQIKVSQGYQISRLRNEDDQWLLAFVVIEEKLNLNECNGIVNMVLKKNVPIRDALRILTGVRCDKIVPVLLPLEFDIQLAMCRSAWNRSKDWRDFCYYLMLQGIDVDIKKVATQLEVLASDLRKVGQRKLF